MEKFKVKTCKNIFESIAEEAPTAENLNRKETDYVGLISLTGTMEEYTLTTDEAKLLIVLLQNALNRIEQVNLLTNQ